MKNFMLWFDASPRSLVEKVAVAAAYFEKKYGKKAEICLVHPGMDLSLTPNPIPLGEGAEIAVRPWRGALPGHLCIGVEDELESAEVTA